LRCHHQEGRCVEMGVVIHPAGRLSSPYRKP
jgi:hypothetical protein